MVLISATKFLLSDTNVGPLVRCPNLPIASNDTNFKGIGNYSHYY
jgi:hypothetical protein